MSSCSRRRINSSIIAGLLLILVGILLFVDRSNIMYFSIFDIIALVAVIGGIVQLLQARSQKEYREGAWWIFFGIWFYFSFHQISGYGFSDTWPLLLIAWGVGHIWKSLEKKHNFSSIKE